MNRSFIKKASVHVSPLFLVLLFSMDSHAQLNPLGGTYFHNQYLSNPAFAGLDSGLTLNLHYRQQWSSVPGAPKTQTLTSVYGLNEKVGVGLQAYNDVSGLLRRMRIMGTYAYHLPINGEDQKLSFGISLGFMNERVAHEDLKGNPADQSVSRFNERETFIDGDFGVAFTSSHLTIQCAIPNMKTFFKKDEYTARVDRALFLTAIGYRLYFPESLDGLRIEPKVTFRGVKGYDNMADFGANVSFANGMVCLMGIYHTSQSASFGMGITYQKSISILGIYTTETSALSTYTNGNFEIALKVNVF